MVKMLKREHSWKQTDPGGPGTPPECGPRTGTRPAGAAGSVRVAWCMALVGGRGIRLSIMLAAVCFTLLSAAAAEAGNRVPPGLEKVGFDQRLNEQVPLDLVFADETGRQVALREYFGQRPVILVLAYYQCPMLCTQVLNGLVLGLRDVAFTPGKEFTVLTVSFDPRETPEIAGPKRTAYLNHYGRPGAEAGWHFLTGQQDAIERLTRAVGFRYAYDAKRDQFAHASGIMVLTPGGRISRYLYDVRYAPRDLRLALVEASQNKIGSPVDQIMLYCFHYDPTAGKYGAAVMNLVRLGGVLTMITLGVFMTLLFRRDRRSAAQAPPTAASTAAAVGQEARDAG
jgi:protein SCO1/2